MSEELWQVETETGIYEADIDTIRHWVGEGRVKAHHRIRKASLNWIEAYRVPALRNCFEGQVMAAVAQQPPTEDRRQQMHRLYTPEMLPTVLNAVCYNHTEMLPDYICTECGAASCRDCANLVGVNNTGVCNFCGGLCHRFQEARAKAIRLSEKRSELGWDDLKTALYYPVDEIATLLIVSAFLGALLVPAFVFKIAIIIFLPIAIIAFTGVVLGCMNFVINRVSTGNMETRYLYDLSALLADMGSVATLAVGVTTVTLGPTLFLLFGGFLATIRQQAELSVSSYFVGNLYSMLMVLSLVWAIFYYPAAMMVWACTQRVTAVVNPLNGFHVMRLLGWRYGRYFVLYLAAVAVGLVQGTLLYALGEPILGNIAVGLLGFPFLYANIVFACIVGRTLFKCSDALGLQID